MVVRKHKVIEVFCLLTFPCFLVRIPALARICLFALLFCVVVFLLARFMEFSNLGPSVYTGYAHGKRNQPLIIPMLTFY